VIRRPPKDIFQGAIVLSPWKAMLNGIMFRA
jgi:hypothetical protein